MEEVEAICTKIGIIDHGKVIAEGTKEELKSIVTDRNSVEITVDASIEIREEEIKKINGVAEIKVDSNKIRISSYKEVSNLDKIIFYFTSNNIEIKNIETQRPDLETVFLTLTGRKLRD
jgi:ABC-2 type transport system ATP-binding protein